jgi:hypothetical protein
MNYAKSTRLEMILVYCRIESDDNRYMKATESSWALRVAGVVCTLKAASSPDRNPKA